ncbi:MAG TPA: hypothetical protein VFT24_13485 [Vicinamibacterales bacterium]|nr:hypothetical protein [Vicinamibacterales bacterium]
MKIQSAPFGLLLSVLLLVPGTPAAAQTAAPAAEVVWSATNDFAGKMMDIDRFDNVYSVGDTIVGGIVLTRKFNPDGFLLWERSYRPDFAVKATWVAADPNGGAYVVGYKFTGSNQSAIGYFVLRYDADGNLSWSDVSDGTGIAVRAVADRAGNAYVTGGLFVAGSFTIGIVKYSPAGRQWVCPAVNPNGNLFPGTPSPTGLYLSDDDGSVAASGTSGYLYYVLSCDQSGSKRFQDFRDHSVYAAGVAINNEGEVYFGNGLAGGLGMQITKYSATGAVQWTNVYPQGDYIYRLALDSLGNVIATGPDYSNYYANWVTLKVAPSGALLWAATFDALTANNEVPAFVALDSLDNVYVTGVGGPEVVAANGSRYMRMVTVKYSAGGALVWTIGSIEGGSGNVVRVGGDGSTLFVQGYGGMYTARYRQTGLAGDVPPPPAPPPVVAPAAPTNLAASSSARARIDLTWTNTATNATSITVQRCSGSTCTAFVAVAQLAATATSWTDSGVKSRSTYRYRMLASNDAGRSPYSNIASATAR